MTDPSTNSFFLLPPGYFEALASLLKTEAPSLCAQATFIFVPGPHDPGASA